jgi:O-acetyl-ADP-ribose deacetylase (regulator of RNase III)
MEVGSGMLFPVSVVDGLVHQLGGMKLALQCKLIKSFGGCPTGTAVSTTHCDEALKVMYDEIIHTAPPFFKHDEKPFEALRDCYVAAFELSFQNSNKVACPLIGAGARGFSVDDALDIAVSESLFWKKAGGKEDNTGRRLMFGIPDIKTAEKFVRMMEKSEQTNQL